MAIIFVVEKRHHIGNRPWRIQGIDRNEERAFLLTNRLYGMIGLQRVLDIIIRNPTARCSHKGAGPQIKRSSPRDKPPGSRECRTE